MTVTSFLTWWVGFIRGTWKAGEMSDAHMAEDQLHVQIWPDELDGGFVVQCIELPGCISQGDTVDEALANIADAISEMLQVIIRENRRPEPELEPGEVRSITLAVSA